MTGHHGHVLKMTVTAFFADRAVMRMVGHQELDHRLAELLGLFIRNRDIGAVGGRRHAGHDDAAHLVVLVLVLLHRALAAGADGAKRRVPAEIRNIEAQRQAGLQQVVCPADLILLAVYVYRRHLYLTCYAATGVFASPASVGVFANPASNSERKNFSADCSGSIAPGACAQKVRPGPR